MRILTVIPARGGSRGIPKKNIRFIGGQPLLAYAVKCAQNSAYDMDVAVSSDDEEIQNIARKCGAVIIERPPELAADNVTLDPVVCHAVEVMETRMQYRYDVVITMQPTSPLLSTKTLDEAVGFFVDKGYDTVLSGVNDPRLSWKVENGECVPNYRERLNRQYLPKDLKETGAFVISKRQFVTQNGRFGEKVSIFEVPEKEAGDIDTPHDWLIAQYELKKKRILVRVEGYAKIGLGHIYRGLQLAESFIEHDLMFVISQKSDIGIQKLEQSHYPYRVIEKEEEFFALIREYHADIVINDVLNTDIAYMQNLRQLGVRIVNFEDLGEGGYAADAVINALYEGNEDIPHSYWGDRYYLIRDEFLLEPPRAFHEQVEEILVIFGGTDPNDLTKKVLKALLRLPGESGIHCTVILGMGYRHGDQIRELVSGMEERFDIVRDVKVMSEYMSRADIAISSQGRTMLELAAMRVPTVIMAQNERESTHRFGSLENGFLNLGLGSETETNTIYETIRWLINCPAIRKNMYEQMRKKDLSHGADRVKRIILGENEV